MLPLDLWECISFYLETTTEVGNLCTALNVPIFLNPLIIPLHIQNDMIACTISHNRKDIFTKIISGSETFLDDLWGLLSRTLPSLYSSPKDVYDWRKTVVRFSRSNGGHPWHKTFIETAAMYCKTEVVIWLYDQHCPWKKEDMCSYAAWSDNLELLLWLREKECPCTANEYRVNRLHGKTHKVGDWMEKEETMGAYLKAVNYFRDSRIPAELLEFAI
jgi:hypothetical protein